MSFAKNMSSKDSQKLLDTAKKSARKANETASKRTSQKTTEEPGDLIGNKITNKNTSISKTSPKDLHSQNEDEIKIL